MKSTSIIKPPVQRGRPGSITWTVEVDGANLRMIVDGYSCAKISSELGNGLKKNINNRWTWYLKKSIIILKPPVQSGWPTRSNDK